MDEILKELKVMLNKVLPAVNTDNVTMESDLRTDLEIDSFNMILLAVSIEDQFGIELDDTFVPKSVGDVCAYIQHRRSDV